MVVRGVMDKRKVWILIKMEFKKRFRFSFYFRFLVFIIRMRIYVDYCD